MTISFDLDDTLIPGTKRFPTVPQTWLHQLLGLEKIRVGTADLMKTLQTRGHRVYVYTTSLRSPRSIWWTFFWYGIRLDKAINQATHEQIMKHTNKSCSKYPPAFSIDVHIDDSPGVGLEGERYNFRTIILSEDQIAWTDFVLEHI